MSNNIFDLIVIGAGPGGYVAAIRASQLGQKVAIVEANHLGGICLNWGCIPTKALLRTAEIHQLLNHADQFGFKVGKIEVDFAKVVQRSRAVSEQLARGVKGLLKKNKVEVFDGFASLKGKNKTAHQVSVEKNGAVVATLEAPRVILATGARARSLPGFEPDGQCIWTYKEAMVPVALPKSLLIIGSGAIGIEFASFYNAMGTEVTVVEVQNRILPVEDEEVSDFARKAFEKRGIKIQTGSTAKGLKQTSQGLEAQIESKDGKLTSLKVEKAIVAIGIIGNIEKLGLEKTQIKTEKNQILTDEWCQTAEAGVYAIGDVRGAPWLAHKASHEAILAVEHSLGMKDLHPLNTNNIPGCTYSAPQIASVGMTERKAKELGHALKVGRFPCIANGKAIALGETEGFVKTIFDAKTGELLGAHMIGPEVTEMIQSFGLAKTLEATELDFMHTIFPHPTLSEMIPESVLDAYGRAIHI
ncbi:MAG: dihydrolipoyl dehydrogenase [Alphaproteobacteria bacterium]|nr:dihydrolipoyl dehydrogenase [Alphaproteobacteria bacterium]